MWARESAMKKFFYLIIIFLVIGLWLGINFARNQPFADEEIRERAVEKVEKLGNKAKDAVERSIEKTLHE
jgi:hypothetical protein